MGKELSFEKDMLVIDNGTSEGINLYELRGQKLRPLAVFYNEVDAMSVVEMANELNEANVELDFLQHQVKNDWDAKYNALLQSRNQLGDLLDELRIASVKLLKANDDQVDSAQWEVALECVRHVIEKIEGGAQ